MKIVQFLPAVMIGISISASVAYVWDGDWRKAAYWAFAAGITASVTF